jgi:endonuclease/exonuclease/phosphatase family metal-dependent hydrolase
MRTRRLALLALLALIGCRPAPHAVAPGATADLRVVSYNIRAGTDLMGRPSLERLAALLDSVSPHIVFLQEVDRGTGRSGGVDQLAELARGTGLYPVFARTMAFDGGEYGTAILTRLPLLDTATVALPVAVPEELSARYYEPRALLHAIVETAAGPLHLLGTHLDHHGPPFFRHPQLFQILAHLAERVTAEEAVIFAGDLNAEPEAAEVRALSLHYTDAWRECGSGEGRTYPADRPLRRIDYVFLRGARCTTAVVLDAQLSDHRPLLVDVRIRR